MLAKSACCCCGMRCYARVDSVVQSPLHVSLHTHCCLDVHCRPLQRLRHGRQSAGGCIRAMQPREAVRSSAADVSRIPLCLLPLDAIIPEWLVLLLSPDRS